MQRATRGAPRIGGEALRREALSPDLPMSPEHIAERAYALGYRTPVYHSTPHTQPIQAFELRRGMDPKDIPAVHVGTAKAAADRARQLGMVSPTKELAPIQTMPLLARMQKQFTGPPPRPGGKRMIYGEEELRELVENHPLTPQQQARVAKSATQPYTDFQQDAFREHLLGKGYDTIPYMNYIEDPGSVSHMILKPENLRSVFAQFDPAKSHLANLMSNRWLATTAGGGAATAAAAYGVSKDDVQDKYD